MAMSGKECKLVAWLLYKARAPMEVKSLFVEHLAREHEPMTAEEAREFVALQGGRGVTVGRPPPPAHEHDPWEIPPAPRAL